LPAAARVAPRRPFDPIEEEPLEEAPAAERTAPRGLVRREETPAAPAPGADQAAVPRTVLHDAEGKFVELVCSGEWATMVLETAEGNRAFVIAEPTRMIVTGKAPGMVDLSCGPQAKPEKIRIQYTESPEDVGGAGVVRAVHFGQP
jgi:hypothetical protein